MRGGTHAGNSSLNISVTAMDNDNGEPIYPAISNGRLSITERLLPLPGLTSGPTVPDGDGGYEDLKGNGRLNFDEVVKFFQNKAWIDSNYPVSAVDFNGNGRVDFDDIVEHFKEV